MRSAPAASNSSARAVPSFLRKCVPAAFCFADKFCAVEADNTAGHTDFLIMQCRHAENRDAATALQAFQECPFCEQAGFGGFVIEEFF